MYEEGEENAQQLSAHGASSPRLTLLHPILSTGCCVEIRQGIMCVGYQSLTSFAGYGTTHAFTAAFLYHSDRDWMATIPLDSPDRAGPRARLHIITSTTR